MQNLNHVKSWLESKKIMYSVRQFSVGKLGKTDNMVIEKLYKQIADHANKNGLKIVKISKMEDGLTSEKLTVIFED